MFKILGFIVGAAFAAMLISSQTDSQFWDRLTAVVASWFGEPASSENAASGVSSRYDLAAAIRKENPQEKTSTAIEEKPVAELSAQSPPGEVRYGLEYSPGTKAGPFLILQPGAQTPLAPG